MGTNTIEKITTAREMNRAIYAHFIDRWAVLTEVTARARYEGGGLAPAGDGDALLPRRYQPPTLVQSERRIDVLLLRAGRAAGSVERLAIEVKVTRSDFLSDVRNPDKQAPWRALAHRHAYAVPEGLVAEAEVPAESGLLVVRRSRHSYSRFACRWVRQAKKPAGHDPGPLPPANLMDAYWRAARAEARIKGYASETARVDDDLDALRAELVRLRGDLDLANKRVEREREAKARWQRAYGASAPPPCGTCGQPLHLITSRRRRVSSEEWEHQDAGHATTCQQIRRAAAVARNDELPENRRIDLDYLWITPPEPADTPALAGTPT